MVFGMEEGLWFSLLTARANDKTQIGILTHNRAACYQKDFAVVQHKVAKVTKRDRPEGLTGGHRGNGDRPERWVGWESMAQKKPGFT
jgi:hypothetical protein